MSIKVKGLFEDIGGAGRVTELRRKKLANASSRPDPRDPIRELADRLHPAEMKFRCVSVTDASPSAKTFRFESVDGHIPRVPVRPVRKLPPENRREPAHKTLYHSLGSV